MENFEVMCTETALLLAFSTAGAVLSYLITSWNLPLIDPWLIKADAMIGFDWLAYAGYVNERPWLHNLSSIVYVTTISQIALCVVVLGLSGRVMDSRRLGAAVIISGLICIGISGILPSAGALGYLRPDADFVASGLPVVDLAYKQEFFRPEKRCSALHFVGCTTWLDRVSILSRNVVSACGDMPVEQPLSALARAAA